VTKSVTSFNYSMSVFRFEEEILTSQSVGNGYDGNLEIGPGSQQQPNSLAAKPRFTFSGIDII